MGKMPINWLGKSSELKLHCFCLFDAYMMPKDMCSDILYILGQCSGLLPGTFIPNVLFIKFCSEHNSNTVLCLLQNLMNKSLYCKWKLTNKIW